MSLIQETIWILILEAKYSKYNYLSEFIQWLEITFHWKVLITKMS